MTFEFIEHMARDGAREKACAKLEGDGALDAVLMMDADQAVWVKPGEPSWIDRVVEQYVSNEDPHRILFGVTGIEGRDPFNFSKAPDGHLEWCGAGLMFVPRAAWARLRERWHRPWTAGSQAEAVRGEDIVCTQRAVEAGLTLEPIRALTVAHWPTYRPPLVVRTNDSGEPTCRSWRAEK